MTPRIVAVGTAVPPYRFTQAELLAMAGYDDARRRGFFAASDIAGRHLWIDPARFRPDESVDELHARFQEGALALAESAARAAPVRAGGGAGALDVVATPTSTVRTSPIPRLLVSAAALSRERSPILRDSSRPTKEARVMIPNPPTWMRPRMTAWPKPLQ